MLSSILGEALVSKGNLEKCGKLTIAEQNPIIITGTVRSNILFGSPYDKEWYDKVISACRLTQDFKQFPKSDLTETGEMGVTLSGGQKSRVSLARALYKKEASIMLIDGTLSSLDARVASQILDEIKHGEMFREKIVIMVTYDLD